MTAVICTYPLDVVRARLAFQVTGDHRYTGIINAFQTIYLKVTHVVCGHLLPLQLLARPAVDASCSLKIKILLCVPPKGGGCPGLL